MMISFPLFSVISWMFFSSRKAVINFISLAHSLSLSLSLSLLLFSLSFHFHSFFVLFFFSSCLKKTNKTMGCRSAPIVAFIFLLLIGAVVGQLENGKLTLMHSDDTGLVFFEISSEDNILNALDLEWRDPNNIARFTLRTSVSDPNNDATAIFNSPFSTFSDELWAPEVYVDNSVVLSAPTLPNGLVSPVTAAAGDTVLVSNEMQRGEVTDETFYILNSATSNAPLSEAFVGNATHQYQLITSDRKSVV